MIIRWFWREWRSPSLLIVWLSLSLAVACVLALGNLSSRMTQGQNLQNRDVMAGDRILRSGKSIPEVWLSQAQEAGLRVSRQITFATMTFAGDTPQLAAVKAVDTFYPMYGKLETRPSGLKPAPGSVLLAPRLLALLHLNVGDELDVGDATLRIAGIIVQEPDAGFNLFQLAPRLMMNLADVPRTGAVVPGSRVTWSYKFAGTPKQITHFEQYLFEKLTPEQRWFGAQQEGSTLGKTLVRSQQFLLLCALLTLLLAVAAVAVAMNHYCRSRYDLMAILKTLGAGKTALRKLVIGQWLLILLLSVFTGGLLGLFFEALLLQILKPVLPTYLPPAGFWPWCWACGSLVVISLLVGIRPYRLLLATQPVRVLRQNVSARIWPLKIYLPIVCLIVIGSLMLIMGANILLWAVLAGALVLAILGGVMGWITLIVLKRTVARSLAQRLAVNRLLRQPWITLSQIAAFSLSFMFLALLLLLRSDLLERWQQQLPAQSPNYFLLNIAGEQILPLKKFLTAHQLTPSTFYPVIRVRMTAIRGQSTEGNSDEALNRELNLTWLAEKPGHNPIVAGAWPPKVGEVSIDKGLADRLRIRMGDSVTFMGDTQLFSAKVSSMRKVDWESLRPNFYFIFPPGALDDQPQSWLTSFRWEGDNRLLTQINREFPTISLLDIGTILRQLSQILFQVSRALEAMVALVILCGLLLLLSQVQVGLRQRYQELVVYRTLGAGKPLLYATIRYEFLILGLVAGLVAAFGAQTALGILQYSVFDLPWTLNGWLWLLLPFSCAGLLALCGSVLSLRLLKGKALFRHFVG